MAADGEVLFLDAIEIAVAVAPWREADRPNWRDFNQAPTVRCQARP